VRKKKYYGKTIVSAGQLLADHFFRGVEVIDEPFAKLRYGTEEQQVKGDFRAWIVPVAVPRGKLVEECRVTLWSTTRPPVHDGDTVRFREVIFGAVEGRIYVQAYRVEVLGDDES
jgi:hypothetical protein